MGRQGSALRVLLLDADRFSREGLRAVFEADGAEIAGDAGTLTEALALAGSLDVDVLVMDPRVAGDEPAEAVTRVAGAAGAPVVVLADSQDEHDVLQALSAGATGYLSKAAPAEQLVAAIRQTAMGNTVLSPDAARGVLAAVATPGRSSRKTVRHRVSLSRRESEVLGMIVEGADNGEIGDALAISRHTVKQHVTNIFDKLGVRTRVEAAVLAVREGLV